MNIGILGSGVVGQTLGAKLVEVGHTVKIGTRDPHKLEEWQARTGTGASVGSFAEAASFGELLFNCTLGLGTLDALGMAGAENLNGKVLIDVSNSLDFSQGFPPTMLVCNTDSLGEQIQRAFPEVKVVKVLNTMSASVMVNPAMLPGEHDVFMSGNDAAAKETVRALLQESFGWKAVIDLGDIKTARGTEMLMPFWLSLMGALKTPVFNIKIVQL